MTTRYFLIPFNFFPNSVIILLSAVVLPLSCTFGEVNKENNTLADVLESKNNEVSFDEAQKRLLEKSNALKAAEARHAGRKNSAEAVESLIYPSVAIDASWLYYEKSFDNDQLDIEGLWVNGVSVPSSTIRNTDVTGRVSQSSVRPIATAMWPIYTGGEIDATKGVASAMADHAKAQVHSTREELLFQLVYLYFGQQLSEQVVGLRKELLAGMQEHLDNAIKLEKGGMLTRSQRLQAQVSYDAAKRGYDDAIHQYKNACIGLANFLRSKEVVIPTTPLFMLTGHLDSPENYANMGKHDNPKMHEAESMRAAASHGVTMEQASWIPKVFLFGEYNLWQDQETPLDADWMVGVAVRWSIFDRVDRNKRVSAARHSVNAAQNMIEEVAVSIDTNTRQALDAVESARRQFYLLESNMDAALENLRVQQIAFQEGHGTSTDVTTARIALTNVKVERAAAVYRFDIELARLLLASGQMDFFIQYMNRQDKVIP